jgi:hypothetical protein
MGISMILATAGVHTHLVRKGLRTFASINVRAAEALDERSRRNHDLRGELIAQLHHVAALMTIGRRGAASDRFLDHAASLVRAAGGIIDFIDLTLICEAPKIGPHRPAMRAEVARLMGLTENAVSIKATTTEKLGFTGRGEGIAAQAIVLVTRTA